MANKRKNYDGMRYENYVVLRRDHVDENGRWWFVCKCDCGKEFMLRNMNFGHVKSCGCLLGGYNTKHGERYSRLYRVWAGMKSRCHNQNCAEYKDYGGRGITICPEWEKYEAFRDWANQNGFDPNKSGTECSIDRIDVNGNYEPSNCRWVDDVAQANNRRSSKTITYNNETHTIAEWAKMVGINNVTLWGRLHRGWSIEDALTIKPERGNKRMRRYEH